MNKKVLTILLMLSIIGSNIVCKTYYVKSEEIHNNVEVKSKENIDDNYIVDLNKFRIKNDGTAPIETTKGINEALKYAKEKGYSKVVMPYGEYCISENESIIMQDNITLDLNGSIFNINANGLQKYTMVNFTGCKNAKLINGILLGDRYTHDYDTIKGSHEWTCGIVFNDSENCAIDNVTVKQFPGYGISSSLGKNISDLIIGVTKQNLQVGNIAEDGSLNNENGTIRTIEPMNISNVGDEFELGYNKGYMGYPYMKSKTYDAYFYDEEMKFISLTKDCKQYKKVSIPNGAKFVNFVFNQNKVPTKGDTDFNNTTLFLTNYKSPYKISITNSTIEENRSLGMGLCGGREFLVENNTFIKNGGGAPGYAIDMEDGWEYMDNYLFKNNKFIENNNDVVVCAGDNITFEGNEFSSTVYMYGRATNYKFLNNKFENIKQTINYEYSTDTLIKGNTYINSKIAMSRKGNEGNVDINNEKFMNSSINAMNSDDKIVNSEIIADENFSVRLAGVYEGCTIRAKKGDLVSSKMYNCKVEDTSLNSQGDSLFEQCEIKNSTINTTNNTNSINFNKSSLYDSNISVSTWGNPSEIKIENSYVEMESREKSLIDISAGKMKNLVFKNTSVMNFVNKPVFNIYDTSYTIPNGSADIRYNTFQQIKYPYVIDGVKLDNGIFNLKEKRNVVVDSKILEPKYLNNKNFKIDRWVIGE